MFNSCVFSATKKVCEDVTGPETAQYMESLVYKSLNHFVDLPCDRYADLDMCSRNAHNVTSLIEWVFLSKEIEPQEESAVFPIIDIVSLHSVDAR